MKYMVQTQSVQWFKNELEKLRENRELWKAGKPVFDFGVKLEDIEDIEDSLYEVKKGNFYIECFWNKGNGKRESTGIVDLHLDAHGNLTKSGLYPLFLMETEYERVMKLKEKEKDFTVELWDSKFFLIHGIQNRMKQICYSGAKARADLLRNSIGNLFNYVELNPGNKKNYKLKLESRIIIIPRREGDNDGKYAFMPKKRFVYRGTLSDALNSDIELTIEKLTEIVDNLGLQLAYSGEEAGSKGRVVVFNKAIQEARNGEKSSYSQNYSGVLYGRYDEFSNYTIYYDAAKNFARVKTFYTSDAAVLTQEIPPKLHIDEETKLFDRDRIYLANSLKDYGKKSSTDLNVLVAYIPVGNLKEKLSLENFANTNKTILSGIIDGIDCHSIVSEDLANIRVKIRRTYSLSLTMRHFSLDFHDAIKDVKEGKVSVLTGDTVIGYAAICGDECRTYMDPVRLRIQDAEEFYEEVFADENHRDWHCPICGKFKRDIPRIFRFDDKYTSADSIEILGIDHNLLTSELAIDCNVVLPFGSARLISELGLKTFTVPTKESFMGYLEGSIIDPISGNTIDLTGITPDMLVPYGAMKGGRSGMAASTIRLINGLFNQRICPDDIIRKTGEITEVNEVFSKMDEKDEEGRVIKPYGKISLHRMKYDSKIDKFRLQEEEIYIGMLSINVTEVGEEFVKARGERDPMKVSIMNREAWKVLEYDNLEKASSLASLYNGKKQDFKLQYQSAIHIYLGDIIGATEVLKEQCQVPVEVRLPYTSRMTKKEWNIIREHHPLFTKDIFQKETYFKNPNGENIVIPPRNLILDHVDYLEDSHVRLDTFIVSLLDIFLNIATAGSVPSSGWKRTDKGFLQMEKLEKYKMDLAKNFFGKWGMIAKMSALVGVGACGKERGCGFIPEGTVIVSDPKFWRLVKKEAKERGIFYDDITSGRQKIYGMSQRDPYIWDLQAMNAVEIWSITHANRYFKKRFGLKYTDIYGHFNGIIVNVLDMITLYQSDADGDIRRVLLSLSPLVQEELKMMRNQMKNYDILSNPPKDSNLEIVCKYTLPWLLRYLNKEAKGSNSLKFDSLRIMIKSFSKLDQNKAILTSYQGKANIGRITVSQWFIQAICQLWYNKGQITKDEWIGIRCFYQTIFSQDGCIRALKAASDLGQCTVDNLSFKMDKKIVWKNGERKGSLREMIEEVAKEEGYGHLMGKFFEILQWWRIQAALKEKDNGEVGPNYKLMTPKAKMIYKYVTMSHGAKPNPKEPEDLFGSMLLEDREHLSFHDFMKDFIDTINS